MSHQRQQAVGSGTHTRVQTPEEEVASPVLVLRASEEPQGDRREVRWTEETIDNEDLNRKKSKICCIYHPPTEFGESSEEEVSESSSSSSESESDSGANYDPRNHTTNCSHNHRHRSRPNAYERQPKHRPAPPKNT